MGIISYTAYTNGQTVDHTDLNAPLDTMYNEFNGSIEAANLASNAVTSSKLANSAVNLASSVVTGILPGSNAASTVGTVVASGIVTADANKDVTGIRNLTMTGTLANASGQALQVLAGTVLMWAGEIANIPSGYLFCNGSAVSRTTYSSLFSAIGTVHGVGDGSTTFNLPDLRDQSIVGAKEDDSNVPKTNVTGSLTQTGGSSTADLAHTHTTGDHTLTVDEIPSHTHDIEIFNSGSGGGDLTVEGSGTDNNDTLSAGALATGGGNAHNHGATGSSLSSTTSIMNPYYALTYMIKF